jgi:hypothetical protein
MLTPCTGLTGVLLETLRIKNEAKAPALYETVTILGVIISRQLGCGRGAAGLMMRDSYIQIRNPGSLVGCFNMEPSSIAESVWCPTGAGVPAIRFLNRAGLMQ